MRRPARGIVQLLPAALLFGLGPIALATLAFEYTDRHSRPRVHHLPDDPWLSAALALRFAQRLGGGKFIAEKVHHSLLPSELSYKVNSGSKPAYLICSFVWNKFVIGMRVIFLRRTTLFSPSRGAFGT
jgi:hypothetical protein